MASFYANGVTGTTHNQSFKIDPDFFFTDAICPNVTADWAGNQRGLLTSCRFSVAGQGSAKQTRGWISNIGGSDWRGTNVFTVPGGYATWQSWQGLTSHKGFTGGQAISYGIDQLWGTLMIGRTPVGGRNILSGAPAGQDWPGYALGMEIGYLMLPTAPGKPAVSSPSVGAMRVTWSPPGSNGDTPITNYFVDYARNPQFSGYTRINIGSAATLLNLSGLPAGLYYVRVAAYNAVATAWKTHSKTSAVSTVTVQGTPPVPPDPEPVIKISIGGVWVPITWLNTSALNAWNHTDAHISKSNVWVDPIA